MNPAPPSARQRQRGFPAGIAAAAVFAGICAAAFLALSRAGQARAVRPSDTELHDAVVRYLREHGAAGGLRGDLSAAGAQPGDLRPAAFAGAAPPPQPPLDPLAADPRMRVEIGATLVMETTAVVEVLFFDRSGGLWPRVFVLQAEPAAAAGGLFGGRGRPVWKVTGISRRSDWRDGAAVRGGRI